MKKLLFLMLTLLAISACNKEESPFEDEKTQLKGTWLLMDITGGIGGTGYEADFTHLEMTDQDRYKLLANGTTTEEGYYDLSNENDQLIIHFVPDTDEDTPFSAHEKTVLFSEGNSKLTLSDPCCDLFVYHFERAGE